MISKVHVPHSFWQGPGGERTTYYFVFYSIKRKISGLSRIIHILKKIKL